MFKKSHKTTRKNSKKFGITLISEDSSFRGDISFQGGLEVQGSVKGQVVSEAPTAKVRVWRQRYWSNICAECCYQWFSKGRCFCFFEC